MAQLTDRQRAILSYLLSRKQAITVKDLADQFDLSERTIRYELLHVEDFLKENDGSLIKKPKVGIRVEIKDESENFLNFNSEDKVIRIMKSDKRRETILNLLLLSDEIVTADYIAERLNTSRQTITNDLKEIKSEIANKNLEIVAKKGEGTLIHGEEIALREAIVNTLLTQLQELRVASIDEKILQKLKSDISLSKRLCAKYIEEVDYRKIYNALEYAKDIMNFTVDQRGYDRLFLYLLVLVKRVKENPITSVNEISVGDKQKEYRLSLVLSDQLNQDFHLSLNQNEILQIAVQSISCNIKFSNSKYDALARKLSPVVDEMIEVLESFPNYKLPGYYKDKLKMNLMSHLRLTIKKYNLRISSSNSLLTALKTNYPEIFTVVYKMAEVFEEKMHIPLDEDEVGFIAIHIVANVEECSKLRSKKALVVCNTGTGVAAVLENRLRNNIPRLQIEQTLSSFDVENDEEVLKEVDFVISTYALNVISKPVFIVSPIISAKEIEQINKYVNGDIEESENSALTVDELMDRYVDQTLHDSFKEDMNHLPRLKSDDLASEANRTFLYSMIVAKVCEALVEIEERFQIKIPTSHICGMVIHILMSIPYWRTKDQNRQYASEEYKEEHLEIYNFIVRKLYEVSVEFDLEIPEKEALALMRYFI